MTEDQVHGIAKRVLDKLLDSGDLHLLITAVIVETCEQEQVDAEEVLGWMHSSDFLVAEI